VLALSNGFNNYILKTQEDMLSSNPLTIDETTFDMDAIMSGLNSASDMPDLSQIGDKVYVNSFLTNIAGGMQVTNNLSSDYLAYIEEARDYATAITYNTGLDLSPNLFTKVKMGETTETEKETVYSLSTLKAYYTDKLSQQDEKYASLAPLVDYLGSIYGKMPGTDDIESESFGDYVLTQYDVIYGDFPTQKNQAVLVIGGNNDMTDLTLAQLGMLSEKQFLSLFPQDGETAQTAEVPQDGEAAQTAEAAQEEPAN
jgi:putative ABC transport system permease protein